MRRTCQLVHRLRFQLAAALAIGAVFIGALGIPVAAAARRTRTLRVFAAASLADPFRELATRFESAHPEVAVQLNLAGSQQLAFQIQQGAAADVFASADTRWMDEVRPYHRPGREPALFARNRLILIVPKTNPARIGRLQDLARRGVRFVIGAEAVPVGKYSREALRNLARSPGFPSDFARRALANVVSEEENVKSVVGKVQLGEADAGMVYRSDITPALARFVRRFEIPDSANVLATYPIVVLRDAEQADAAEAFVDLVLSPEGQSTLEKRGLIPITGGDAWKP